MKNNLFLKMGTNDNRDTIACRCTYIICILYATDEGAFITSHKKIVILFEKRCNGNDQQQKHYFSCYIIPTI
jgi:hypothetical protein